MPEEDNLSDKEDTDKDDSVSDDDTKDKKDGDGTEGEENASKDSVSLAEIIKKETGREYDDDEAALKGLKETYGYVGKAGEFEKENKKLKSKINKDAGGDEKVLEQVLERLDDTDKAIFYSKNPEYAKHEDLISSLGEDPAEVVKTNVYKDYAKKANAQDEAEETGNVLKSNPRLGQAEDKVTKSKEALKEGDRDGAVEKSVDAVLDVIAAQEE